MENTIEVNGKVYTEEEVRELASEVVKVVSEVWNGLKNIYRTLMKRVNEVINSFVEFVRNYKPVGYMRMLKMDQLKAYEAMSQGKSNNWRKAHGLPLVRCRG